MDIAQEAFEEQRRGGGGGGEGGEVRRSASKRGREGEEGEREGVGPLRGQERRDPLSRRQGRGVGK